MMRIRSSLLALTLLCGGTAFAHEAPFEAVWVQPVAPILVRGPIIPIGLTHGLTDWADLTVEMTPYYSGKVTCLTPDACRQSLFGLVATGGVTFGRPFLSTPAVELGWMVAPKVLLAVANETAAPNAGHAPFSPGTAMEIGGGLDFGLEIHGPRFGLYAALVVGVALSAGFGIGGQPDFGPTPPSWPAVTMNLASGPPRQDTWVPGINLNLLRVGLTF